MNVVLYARVSTVDQDCAMQLRELREYCSRRGWEVSREYVDTGWRGGRNDRPQLTALMRDMRRYDAVVVWKLDRFGRSAIDLNQNVLRLKSAGVRFLAITQAIDTDQSNPAANLLLQILAAIAEFEGETIRERVKAGVEHARRVGTRSGKALGRPRRLFRQDVLVELHAQGVSTAEIARRLEIGEGTARRALAKILSVEPSLSVGIPGHSARA